MAWIARTGIVFLALVLFLLLALGSAVAQIITNTTSTTAHTTTTSEVLPAKIVGAGSGPAATYLTQILAGPNSAAVSNALVRIGALNVGPVVQVGQDMSNEVTITTDLTIGPGTVLIGADQSMTFFVAAGTSNLNTNTHTETFIHTLFQSSQSLSAGGLAYLTGDLHTTFHTPLLHDGFRFLTGLLSRGPAVGTPASQLAAAGSFTDAPVYGAQTTPAPIMASVGDGWQTWINGAFASATYDGGASNLGFTSRTTSVEGGIERATGQWLYGAALGFGHAWIHQDRSGDKVRINTARGGVYASFRPDPWSFTAAVAVGRSAISASRLTLLPAAARASYDATTFSAGVEVSRRLDVGGLRVEPMAGLTYTVLRVDGFSETGTGLLDLAGSGATIHALRGYLGGRVSKTLTLADIAVTPGLHGRLLYDFLGDRRGYTARFLADPAATPIAVTGIRPGRLAGTLGVSLAARFSQQWQAFAAYEVELHENSASHFVSGGLRLRW